MHFCRRNDRLCYCLAFHYSIIMSAELSSKPYFFSLKSEIRSPRWRDIPLAVHNFTQENNRIPAIKTTPSEIAKVLTHLPPNGPIIFSFDYHDTLIPREQENFLPDFINRFNELKQRLTQSLSGRAIFIINSQSEALEKFDRGLDLPIIYGNGFGIDDHKKTRKILPDKKMLIFNNVCDRLGNPDSGIKFIRKTDGYGYIEIDTLADTVPLTRESITKMLEQYISPEEAELLDIYWGSNGRKIKFFPGTSKIEAGQQYIRDQGYDPSNGIYIHFGDDDVDIPTSNLFMANYFIAPESSSKPLKRNASYIAKGKTGEFVLDTLDLIHKELLSIAVNPNPFFKHPYSAFSSFSGMRLLDADEEAHKILRKPEKLDLESHKEVFFTQMNRLALKLTESLGRDISNTVILPILRGGTLAGIDLAYLLFKYTGVKIPVEGIKMVFPTPSDQLRVSTAQSTVRSLLKKHPNLRTFLLVDDWTGAGKQMFRHKALLETVLKEISKSYQVFSVSPIDPIHICDFGEHKDILNPFSAFNESPGIKTAELSDGEPITRISEVEDRHLLLESIFDFQRRASLPRNNICYVNERPKPLPNLLQYQYDWGLGINEALHRARKNDIIFASSEAQPVLDQLGVDYLSNANGLPFGWQAISVPRRDLSLLLKNS